jgi:hypothetical protein
MSPPIEEPNVSSNRMSIHELGNTNTMSLTEFLNCAVSDDNKNVLVRFGLNENQVINVQYCENGEITPYIENLHPGNSTINNEPEPLPLVEEANDNDNITTENDDQTLEGDDDDDDDSNASRVEATQEEIYLRETALIQEENEANQLEFELTTRENMLEISLCAREVLLVRREYEVTRRHRFLKLREKFIKDHEDETYPQVEIIRGFG